MNFLSRLGRIASAIAVVFGTLLVTPAGAQSVVATGQSFITPKLLSGMQMPDGGRMAGLRLSLEPGWKTYWRSPGETGVPPRFDWSQSSNVKEVVLHWPRPGIFESFGMSTAGYSDVVLFPLEVQPIDPGLPVQLNLSAELGVCKDICVLELVETSLQIDPGEREIGARQVRSALRQVPTRAERHDASLDACRFAGSGRQHTMTAMLSLGESLSNPVVLVEHTGGAWIRKTDQRSVAEGVELEVSFSLPEGQNWIDRSAFRMTLLADEAAFDIQGCTSG